MGEIKVIRVVIDTNVLISALLFGGETGKLVPLWTSGRIQPLASREIINEYLCVLAYPKFQLTEQELKYLLYREILPWFEIVSVPPGEPIVKEDPADDKFIWCAEYIEAEYLISGDYHLLGLESVGVQVVTPAEFLSMSRLETP